MKHLMHDKTKVFNSAARNVYGKSNPSVFRTLKGRFLIEDEVIRNTTGEDIVSNAHVYYPGDEDLSLEQRIQFEDVDYQVVLIKKPKTTKQVKYVLVYLQRKSYV